MSKANEEVREALSGVSHYLVARKIGVSESTFGRMLRFELSAEKKKAIISAACELKREQKREAEELVKQ